MSWFKRIFFFMAVNVLIVLTISILMQVLGVQPYLTARGLDYEQLAVFCLIWGMGGSFISLLLSKFLAKRMMGVVVIDPENASNAERNLVAMVHRLAMAANLPGMPEVGIYNSPEVNAFATGPSKKRALVAVSTGLLQRMDSNELEGVLGHEVSHIANGDMVTMTLIQGVVNAFVMFLARVLAFAISQAMRSGDDKREGSGFGMQYMLTFALEMVFGFLGMIVVCYFSRWREFRADRGSALVAGRGKMIAALQRLKSAVEIPEQPGAAAVATLKISSGPKRGFSRLFMTHPPLDERIERLQAFVG